MKGGQRRDKGAIVEMERLEAFLADPAAHCVFADLRAAA